MQFLLLKTHFCFEETFCILLVLKNNFVLQNLKSPLRFLKSSGIYFFFRNVVVCFGVYVFCDFNKSCLTEGTESSPPVDEKRHFTKVELYDVIKAIVRYLHVLTPNKNYNVPPLITNAIELIRNIAFVTNKHKSDKL